MTLSLTDTFLPPLRVKLIVLALVFAALPQPVVAQAGPASSNNGRAEEFAWRRTDTYVPPDFDGFFPENAEGAARLEALWRTTNKESLPLDQVLSAVRAGLRRSPLRNRTEWIRWIGQRYVWNAKPQDPLAIEIMYHAADFRGEGNDRYGVRSQAVYFGLSVVLPKTPAILRALAELCVAVDDANDIGRVAWGANADREELTRYLEPFLRSPELLVREKAEALVKIFSGQLGANQWSKDNGPKRARLRYAEELPQIRAILENGTTAQRQAIVQRLLQEPIVLAMDDSFIASFAACATDPDSSVRARIAGIVVHRWAESANVPDPALDLLLKLSEDTAPYAARIAFNALLRMPDKDRRVIQRLVDMAPAQGANRGPDPEIVLALQDDQEVLGQIIVEFARAGETKRAAAARKLYRRVAAREFVGLTPSGPPRTIQVGTSADCEFTSVQKAIDAATSGSVVKVAPGRFEERLFITKPITIEGAGADKTVIVSRTIRPSEGFERKLSEKMTVAQTEEQRQTVRQEYEATIQAMLESQSAVRIAGAKGVVLRNLKITDPGIPSPSGTVVAGMVACSRSRLLLENCLLVGTPSDALHVRTTDLEMRHCLVAAAWGTGISLDVDGGGGTAAISDCDIRNCHHVGILIGYSMPTTVERCRISGSAWHGIRYGGAPQIVNCLIFGNFRTGIYAHGMPGTVITNNVFYRNEMGAIAFFESKQERIEGNTFIENKRAGVSVLGPSQPLLRRNVFAENNQAIFCAAIQGESPKLIGAPVLENNWFWNNQKDVLRSVLTSEAQTQADPVLEIVALRAETESIHQDPQFNNLAGKDFSFQSGSPTLRERVGAVKPLAFESPWPLQPEERAIIPDGDSRDDRLWKRPKPE